MYETAWPDYREATSVNGTEVMLSKLMFDDGTVWDEPMDCSGSTNNRKKHLKTKT
jgi:hypothetical protein